MRLRTESRLPLSSIEGASKLDLAVRDLFGVRKLSDNTNIFRENGVNYMAFVYLALAIALPVGWFVGVSQSFGPKPKAPFVDYSGAIITSTVGLGVGAMLPGMVVTVRAPVGVALTISAVVSGTGSAELAPMVTATPAFTASAAVSDTVPVSASVPGRAVGSWVGPTVGPGILGATFTPTATATASATATAAATSVPKLLYRLLLPFIRRE